jgi:Na+-transporting NADH:ubiquinone oxidoreductase subunit F
MADILWKQIGISVLFLSAVALALSILLILAEKKILNYGECTIDINDGKRKLPVQGGSSLLSSLADNNIFIPSACGGRGTCAYCKVRVHSGGGMIGPVEEPYLSPEEREQDVRLSFQIKVRSDVTISVPAELFAVKKFRATVSKKKPLTHDIIELGIKLIEPEEMEFTAGQYVQLESKKYKGRESVSRAYSISSAPSERNSLELIIRKVPEGICTTWVFDHLSEGDEINLSGPYGDFRLSENEAPIIFIAGGSGMAPIWSILQDMREKGISRKASYFFGALTQRDLFFLEDMKRMEQDIPDFNFIPALSNEEEGSGWAGERGLITEVVRRAFPDSSSHEAYLCGSPGMINACIDVLTSGGTAEEKIFFDKFG